MRKLRVLRLRISAEDRLRNSAVANSVSLPKLFGVLEQSRQPAIDRQALLRWVIFQVLVGNTDAHGKNLAFFSDSQGLRFAPMYDVVCIAALGASQIEDAYAMAIGDAFCEREISAHERAHFADTCRIPPRNLAVQLKLLASRVLEQLPVVVADVAQSGVPGEVATPVAKVVTANCQRHLAMGDRHCEGEIPDRKAQAQVGSTSSREAASPAPITR